MPLPFLEIARNIKLYYKQIDGCRDLPHLVFLHEGLGCTAMWKSFPGLLCEMTGCPGLLYDRLGYGRSTSLLRKRTLYYMHDYALQELPLLLQAVIPDKRHILIGHSDGGSIGLIYGTERWPGLEAIITEAAHVFVEPETVTGITAACRAWEKGDLHGLAKYHGSKTESVFRAWSETWLSDWFLLWNIESQLPDIKVPLLVIQGECDNYGTLAQVNSIIALSSGRAYPEIVKGCGHIPHLQAEQHVLQCMAHFIQQLHNPGTWV
jgi:pimeloyl-ACP methyl ester carboxylesterase